jgi:hypothetical protein
MYSAFQMAPAKAVYVTPIPPMILEIPYGLSSIVNLSAGTYALTGVIAADWYDSSGNLLSPSTNNKVINGATYFYQVKV